MLSVFVFDLEKFDYFFSICSILYINWMIDWLNAILRPSQELYLHRGLLITYFTFGTGITRNTQTTVQRSASPETRSTILTLCFIASFLYDSWNGKKMKVMLINNNNKTTYQCLNHNPKPKWVNIFENLQFKINTRTSTREMRSVVPEGYKPPV